MNTKPFNAELFLKNLDTAIAFHRGLGSDPHGIQNAVICTLEEVKDAFGWAMKGQTTPKPNFKAPNP